MPESLQETNTIPNNTNNTTTNANGSATATEKTTVKNNNPHTTQNNVNSGALSDQQSYQLYVQSTAKPAGKTIFRCHHQFTQLMYCI